jgi:hypothetical protein
VTPIGDQVARSAPVRIVCGDDDHRSELAAEDRGERWQQLRQNARAYGVANRSRTTLSTDTAELAGGGDQLIATYRAGPPWGPLVRKLITSDPEDP